MPKKKQKKTMYIFKVSQIFHVPLKLAIIINPISPQILKSKNLAFHFPPQKASPPFSSSTLPPSPYFSSTSTDGETARRTEVEFAV